MKVTDAFWERRNLGLSVAEIDITNTDLLNELAELQPGLDKEYNYICLKCSVGLSDFLFGLGGLGYTFLETQIALKYSIGNHAALPSVVELSEDIEDQVSFQKIQYSEEFEELITEVLDPRMFVSDRIFLDKVFPEEQAGFRYACWCRDLRERGAAFYFIVVGEKRIGFICLKTSKPGTYESPLGGMFSQFNEYALYTPAISTLLFRHLSRDGMKSMHTAVSSNNKAILKFHLSAGYSIQDVRYVYIKHNRGEV